MKTLNLNEKSFQLENDVFKFLHDYIERINTFVAKNEIDTDLHQDILQRLADKLAEKATEKTGITQKVAIQIVNNLGEPEEIFAEEEFSSSHQENSTDKEQKIKQPELFYEKLQKSDRNRPQESAILLGVCGMFGQGTGWNVRFWRGLTLFASYIFLASGTGILFFWGVMAYLLLALIFPITEKNYEKRSVFSYFLTQIWDLRLLISNSIKFGFRSVKRVLGTAIPTLLKRGAKLFGPFWSFVKICFLFFRSIFLVFVLGILGIMFYYLQTGYVWNNMEITSRFPAITSLGLAFGFLSALLLLLGSIGVLSKKRLMNTATLSTAIISGVFAIIIAGITGVQFFSKIESSEVSEFTKELYIPIPEKNQPLSISIEPNNLVLPIDPFQDFIIENSSINYIPYEGTKIKAVFKYQINAYNKETFAKITENLSELIYEIKDDVLHISHKNHQLFDAVVPLAPMIYSVDLYIPKNRKFNTKNPVYRTNLHKPERMNKRGYSEYDYDPNANKCSELISYVEEENAFFCPIKFNLDTWNIRNRINDDIRDNKADKLSPLEGLNRDWSLAYRNDSQYWNLDSILWKDNQKFIVKLSDRMFNIFLEVEARVDENGEISYTKSIVKGIEQKGIMTSERMKLYRGRENLKTFDLRVSEEQDSNPSLEQRIELLENRIKNLEQQINETYN
ncbi:PspC domain-containing protein [Candidatus Gracilibacteria bacterium]|nr:MAG: PspC domain-containing protein [Candidatus Gracilibacteria bacterium]